MNLPRPYWKLSETERRRRRALATNLGIGYIIGWLMGYDTHRQRQGW